MKLELLPIDKDYTNRREIHSEYDAYKELRQTAEKANESYRERLKKALDR